MIVYAVERGSEEWRKLHLGLPTASEFDKIVTPAKGELSKQARGYAYRLAAERLLNAPMQNLDGLEWLERSKTLQPEAVRLYEATHEVQTELLGFATTDDGRFGASPDRLIVGRNGGLEVTCPATQTQVGYLIDGFGYAYRVQSQGQILVCELEFVDRLSYHPDLPSRRERTYRDEPFIRKLAAALDQFCELCDQIMERMKRIEASGFFGDGPALLLGPVQLGPSRCGQTQSSVARI